MDRTAKIEFNNDVELTLHDISRFEQKDHKLKIYREEELVASLNQDDIKNWYIRSGYTRNLVNATVKIFPVGKGFLGGG